MKNLFLFTLIITLFSCVEPSTITIHEIQNSTNHNIKLSLFYNSNETITLISQNTTYHEEFSGRDELSPFLQFDSIVIIYDNLKKTKYINGTVDINNRNPAIPSNWNRESYTENKRKKRYKTVYKYTFTEQDYLDAR